TPGSPRSPGPRSRRPWPRTTSAAGCSPASTPGSAAGSPPPPRRPAGPAGRPSEADAHQDRFGLQLDAEGAPDAVAHLAGQLQQVLRAGVAAVGERERVLG